jgi:hypothetical protein
VITFGRNGRSPSPECALIFGFIRHPPGSASFAVSVVPFTGFGNGKLPSTPAKSDRDLPLKRSTAEMCPICLLEGVPLP